MEMCEQNLKAKKTAKEKNKNNESNLKETILMISVEKQEKNYFL